VTPRTALRPRVLAGEVTVGAFAMLASPLSTELLGRAGFDWLVIDLEHGAGTDADLLPDILAARAADTAALVRPQSGERLRIGRALDAGADGIMVPRLETPADVEEAVGYLRYPPAGVRGVALVTRGAGLGAVAHADVHELNEPILGIFQVESGLAVTNARAIAAIDGVDVLFVGPADLSHAMGIPGQFDHPVFVDALRTVAGAAAGAGKAAGILLRTASEAERHLELGYRFLGIGSDGAFVTDGARAAIAAAGVAAQAAAPSR
jgi:2-dehydro-3-deoxyglucarate aldolase/4-hydroxy-2-oxoheptanedioate aldolase